jgi:Nif-specific regulatory protein
VEPLRRRPEDLLPLAEHYRARFAKRLGRAVDGFTQAALRAIEAHKWPGNLRELRNTIYRAVALCRSSMMDVNDLYLTVTATGDHSTIVTPNYQARSLEDVELAHILATLNQTDWNKTRASQILQIERSTLDRKLKRFGLQRPRPNQPE